jgi:hypothetical protein
LKNLDAINAISDSIIFVFDKITEEMKALKLTKEGLIKKIQSTGKPVAVSFISSV